MYKVNPKTCAIEEDSGGTITLKSAALLAYHLAGEQMNHWSEVKNAAWQTYEEEVAKAQESAAAP